MIKLIALMVYVEVVNDNIVVLLFTWVVHHKILSFNKTQTE